MSPMKLVLVTSTFVFATALSSCTNDRTAASGDRAPASTRMSDGQIEDAIKARFNQDATLARYSLDVDADVNDNKVTVKGKVATQEARTLALAKVKDVNASLIVVDKIDVAPGELSRADYTEEMAREARMRAQTTGNKIGDSLDDAWIHSKIVAKLIGNPDTPQRKINVDVVNNVVTLRGSVNTAAEKAEAENVAKATEGVKRVTNRLVVRPA